MIVFTENKEYFREYNKIKSIILKSVHKQPLPFHLLEENAVCYFTVDLV